MSPPEGGGGELTIRSFQNQQNICYVMLGTKFFEFFLCLKFKSVVVQQTKKWVTKSLPYSNTTIQYTKNKTMDFFQFIKIGLK